MKPIIVFLFLFLLHSRLLAAPLEIYGRVQGFQKPQKLTLEQVDAIRTYTHGNLSTWLGIVAGLDTNQPQLHLIDTQYYQDKPAKYGLHEAYARDMGLASSSNDFIARLKRLNGQVRSIMPLTLYVPNAPLLVKGQAAYWVLQNRRYVFADDSVSFTQSLVQCEEEVARVFPYVQGPASFITYQQADSHRRPNLLTSQGQSDIEELSKRGHSVLTEDDLASQVGAALEDVQIYNPNEGNEVFGFLKVVQNEKEAMELTPQHIAIFPELPDRIPPVAGIVTLETQTELSHINVLAINRGTLNVGVRASASGIQSMLRHQAEQFEGQPVRLQAFVNRLEVTKATQEQMVDFQNQLKAKVGQVEIPVVQLTGNLKVTKPTDQDSPATVGAKAANYGRIERLLGNQWVEPGFAIGFDLYRQLVTQGGANSIEATLIQPLLQKIKAGALSPAQVNEDLEKIRQAIAQQNLPTETLQSLVDLVTGPYQGIDKIRFRSSTNCEDLPRFNGAGLYLSEGIKTKHLQMALTDEKARKKVHEDLLLVMGSLWLPRAFWEREYFSIDHGQAAMAIQINPSFSEEAANGVIIVSKEGDTFRYWVNSQKGEASVTNPGPGEVPESIKILSKATGLEEWQQGGALQNLEVGSLSNLANIFVQENKSLEPSKVSQLIDLLNQSQRVFQEFVEDPKAYAVDIEFKLVEKAEGLQVFLKQARPLRLDVGTAH